MILRKARNGQALNAGTGGRGLMIMLYSISESARDSAKYGEMQGFVIDPRSHPKMEGGIMRRSHRYSCRRLDYDSFKTTIEIALSLRLGKGFQVRSIVDHGTDLLLILSENLQPVGTPLGSLYEGYLNYRSIQPVLEAVRASYLVSARTKGSRGSQGEGSWNEVSDAGSFLKAAGSMIGHRMMEGLEKLMTAVQDREFAMSHVVCSVMNQERNAEDLAYMPHVPFLDLAVTFNILINPESGLEGDAFGPTILAPVVTDLYDFWNVQSDEFIDAARENTLRLMPCRFLPADAFQGAPVSYVMTNDRKLNGSYWMTDEDSLEEMNQRMEGRGFYILPSSLNECMIVGRGKMTIAAMRELLKKNNTKHQNDELFLSDNIYYYSAVKKKVRIV